MGLEDIINKAHLTAEIAVAGLPPVYVAVRTDTPPNFLMMLFRPRIRIYSGNVLLEEIQPAGSPQSGTPTGAVFIGLLILALGGIFLLGRASK